jgi:diguanylate cyclase (GGDEF)-like protein
MRRLEANHQLENLGSAKVEDLRLSALNEIDLLDTPQEEAFDRIARLVRFIFKVPVAFVSLMDAHRLWHKACLGLDTPELERKDSFCRYPVASGEPLVIQDTRLDPRVSDNPHVTGPTGVRFYAGVPLKTDDGHILGTVCAIDFKPRDFDHEQLQVLIDIAAVVEDAIKLRQLAGTDSLTGLLSRRAFKENALQIGFLAARHNQALSCIAIDIDHFKKINDSHGHSAGDQILVAVATACKEVLRTTDIVGRLGGEEFAVFLPQTGRLGALEAAEKLRRSIRSVRVHTSNSVLHVTASLGVAALEPYSGDVEILLAHADEALYGAKNAGRDRTVLWKGTKTANRRVLKAGRIVFNKRHSTIDCTVRSLGEEGAGIDVWNAHDIPDRFTLALGTESMERNCKVTSRTDKHIDVIFI